MVTKRTAPKDAQAAAAKAVVSRLEAHVKANWPQCDKFDVRTKGQFVYVLAGTVDDEEAEPLCRLGYTGSVEQWAFAYFSYSNEKYEPSFLDTGSPYGSPEECFDCAAALYLAPAEAEVA
jgi:hypothetical protein